MAHLISQVHSGTATRVYRPPNHCFVEDIRCIFEINDKTVLLGQGVSGKVYKTCLKANVVSQNSNVKPNTYYALKCMNKSVAWIEKSFLRESHNMVALAKIPGTINIIGTFEDSNYLCILSELAGSDAFSMVKKAPFGRLDENYVKYCIYEILKSIFCLHGMNYVHRDIKPENIVLTQSVSEQRECHVRNSGMNGDECNGTQILTKLAVTQPKLIDLADCGSIDDKSVYNKLVGTMCYLAPERLRAHYGYELKKADVWAVGVSCYEMLSGKRCFFGVNNDQLFERIKQGKWVWPQGLNISQNAKNFVSTLLEPNCNRRPSAGDALLHPWFCDIVASENNSSRTVQGREHYIKNNPLIARSVGFVECEQHFVCQAAPMVPGTTMFTMQLPSVCMPSNSNMNIHANANVNNSNTTGNFENNQISPSASTFSNGRSCSPAFTAETGGCDTPTMQNIGLVMQGQSYFNLNSQPQYLQAGRNQIPKFLPAQPNQVKQQQQQQQQSQLHCQSPHSVQSMQSGQSPRVRMQMQTQMQMQTANQVPMQQFQSNVNQRFAFV